MDILWLCGARVGAWHRGASVHAQAASGLVTGSLSWHGEIRKLLPSHSARTLLDKSVVRDAGEIIAPSLALYKVVCGLSYWA